LETSGALKQEFAAAKSEEPAGLSLQMEKIANVVAARKVLSLLTELSLLDLPY
jgi:hypothetical protein